MNIKHLSLQKRVCAVLLLSPCDPAARRGCWRSPPPTSGNVWRRGCGSRFSRPAPSRQRWRWPCHRKWPCPCLRTGSQRSGASHAIALITDRRRRRRQTYPTHPGARGSAWWRGAGCSPSHSAPRRKCSPLQHKQGW